MATEPTHPTGLSAETRAIIGVVLEALDIPYAATVGHEKTRAKILADRIMSTVVVLRGMVTRERAADLPSDLEYLREQLDPNPAAGYVTAEQARARCDAGASWMDAVRLDYQGPDAPAEGDGPAPTGDQADVPAPDEDEQDDAAAAVAVRLVKAIDRNADLSREFADEGETDLASAFADVSLAWREVAAALGSDMGPAIAQVDAANVRARAALAGARARQDDDTPPLVAEDGR